MKHYVLQPRYAAWRRIAALVMVATGIVAVTASASAHDIRLGYVIPSNRTAQPDAVANLQAYLPTLRQWYGEQMDRYGFGFKTFRYETLLDGVTPLVRVVNTAQTDANIRTDIWARTLDAAASGGLSVWTPGQVWMLFSEAHQQQANASVIGGTALGASFGSGSDPGVSMGGGDFLFRLHPGMLTNNQAYAGQIVPQIGTRPLVQGVSFPGFEQSTFSSIASSAQGAMAHELGHAFGLPHDFRNDRNFHGNLMGNGFRGWRASFFPDQYSQDDAQLSYAAALVLNTSRYFNPERVYGDNTPPTLTVQTSGNVTPSASGHLQINFNSSDPSGLSSAFLRRGGDFVGEMRLTGSGAFSFSTPYFNPGQNEQYSVAVYDTQGNVRSQSVQITPTLSANLAPQPSISLSESIIDPGELVTFDATRSSDPNHSLSLVTVEWDFNFDGVYDTAPSTTKTFTTSFAQPGARLIAARLTDPSGSQSVSSPLALRVVPEPSTWVFVVLVLVTLTGYRSCATMQMKTRSGANASTKRED